MYWHGSKGFQAIRVGDWKLFPEAKNAKLPGGSEGPALFHLKKDPSETVNLASQYPDRVKQMQALAKQQLDAIMEQKIPLGESLP
jgi:arylsulfatase A-like enzyme